MTGVSSLFACLPRVGWRLCMVCALAMAAPAHAQWVVVEARGGGVSVGQTLPAAATLSLQEGERVMLISPDGRALTLRGPFSGPPAQDGPAAADPVQALAVLVASRDARTRSVGVVRAGTDTVKTPDPWAIDITRGGPRCLREGEQPELWRPQASAEQTFVIFPADRSWRADFVWQPGQDRMLMPALSRLQRATTLLVNIDQQEHALTFARIPAEVSQPFVLAAWMLEKGCIQQGDALLRLLSAQFAAPAPGVR